MDRSSAAAGCIALAVAGDAYGFGFAAGWRHVFAAALPVTVILCTTCSHSGGAASGTRKNLTPEVL